MLLTGLAVRLGLGARHFTKLINNIHGRKFGQWNGFIFIVDQQCLAVRLGLGARHLICPPLLHPVQKRATQRGALHASLPTSVRTRLPRLDGESPASPWPRSDSDSAGIDPTPGGCPSQRLATIPNAHMLTPARKRLDSEPLTAGLPATVTFSALAFSFVVSNRMPTCQAPLRLADGSTRSSPHISTQRHFCCYLRKTNELIPAQARRRLDA